MSTTEDTTTREAPGTVTMKRRAVEGEQDMGIFEVHGADSWAAVSLPLVLEGANQGILYDQGVLAIGDVNRVRYRIDSFDPARQVLICQLID